MPEDQEKLRQVVSGVKHRVSHKLSDVWWWFMIRGVLALGLAVVALFWPQKTVGILVSLLGAFLLFDGVVGVIGAVRSGGKNGFPVIAIVSLIFGAFPCLRAAAPGGSLNTLAPGGQPQLARRLEMFLNRPLSKLASYACSNVIPHHVTNCESPFVRSSRR